MSPGAGGPPGTGGPGPGGLRRRAEVALEAEEAGAGALLTGEEALTLVHELRVHQVELELQNEELQRTRREAEELRDRYADLYDFAPVGYFTLDAGGVIREANLTGSLLLATDRESLIGARFAAFLDPASVHLFARFCDRVRSTGTTETCDLLLSGFPGHLPWYAQLKGRAEPAREVAGPPLRLVVSDVTARRRAEEEVRGSEERYRGLVDDDLTGVFASSPAGRILDCNPAFARIFGFASVEEARSASIVDTYDAPSEREALLERLRRERRLENDERFRRRRDGTRIHVVENIVGEFDDAGALVGIRGYISDDTQRYRAEAALQESERRHAFLLALGDRLRELAGVGEIAAVASELVGRHLGVNGAVYCEIDAAGECATVRADWTDGTVPGAAGSYCMDDFGIGDLYRRGLVRRTEDVTAALDENEVAAHRALQIRASLGVPICRGGRLSAVLAVHSAEPRPWTDAEVELVRDAGDRVWSAVERARAQEALRESETRLREANLAATSERDQVKNLLEIAGVMILALDTEGRVTLINRRGCEILNRPEEEVLGTTWVDTFLPERVRQGLNDAVARAVAGDLEEFQHNEYPVLTRDGEERHILWSNRPITDAGGRIAGILSSGEDITERKRVEEELRQAYEHNTAVLESISDSFMMLDTDWRFTYINRRALGYSGKSPEDVIGRSIWEEYPEILGTPLEAFYRTAMESVEPLTYENPSAVATGRHFELRTYPTEEGLSIFGRDITKRRRAEASLRESEKRHELIAGVASLLLAADEPQAVVNDICTRALAVLDGDVFFNYFADEASGRFVLNAYGGITAEEAERIRWLDCSAAACGCVARNGCRVMGEGAPDNPDPATAPIDGFGVRASACHPLVVAGETIGTLSFGTRSRDRFAAEELATMRTIADLIAIALQRIADRDALRASEARIAEILESISDGFFALDASWTFTYINRRAAEILGGTPAEILGRNLWERFPLAREGEMGVVFCEVMEDRVPRRFEYVGVRTGRYYEISVYPGSGGGISVYWLEITERRRAEDGLKTYAERLQTSNEELQRFAYVASHDLQEPLRSIVSFSQLLERRYKGRLDQDADDYIKFIVDGGQRMQALIRDLLQFSRIETQARPPEPCAPGVAVAAALRLLEASLAEAGATVTVGEMPVVMADPTQLEQVFANLVGNAVKYRRPGVPPAITISAHRVGPMVQFAVQDNGIGIEAEYFDRIFEMFRRLHTNDKYSGTGIGLAVVQRIVERHGGTIRVESVPGEGSTFFFTLPAA